MATIPDIKVDIRIHAGSRKVLRGQTSGNFKTQKMNDKEYIVVPVIAMVEGVRYGANQESPELGLASEFGKFPDAWNNRPIVLGHPKVDGEFVSAGSPAVMEEYCIGTTMNSRLQGKKLKMEAWLDVSQKNKNQAAKEMFKRLEANEIVEVSVGFFTEVEDTSGEYDGEEYSGVWRNIATDHLAFLEAGTIGACSYEDGCGAPRVYAKPAVTVKETPATRKQIMSNISNTIKKALGVKTHKKGKLTANCACDDKPVTLTELTIESVKALSAEEQVALFETLQLQQIRTQAIPDGLLSSDVNAALSTALNEMHGYVYVMAFTNTSVVYQMYNDGWCTMQQSFDVDGDGNVAFTGEPEEVRLITRIVPAGDADEAVTTQEVNSTETPTEENPMTTKNQSSPAAEATTTAAETATTTATETVTTRTVADVAATPVAQPVTLSAFIENAPAELRDVLTQSVKAHEAQKSALIDRIKANKQNAFDDAFLKSQNLDMLANLAKLAGGTAPVVNYTGVAAPVVNSGATNEGMAPAAPLVFARKTDSDAA